MKSKLVRIAAVLGVFSALATVTAPAGAATTSGAFAEPPWSQFCADSYGAMCVPNPGPFAL
jgi:hypothetical protein